MLFDAGEIPRQAAIILDIAGEFWLVLGAMKTHPAACAVLAALFLVSAPLPAAVAGSATWKASPVNSEWNNASNWTPATVPNGASDVATFGASGVTTVVLDVSAFHPVAELVFKPGASAFTFNVTGDILEIEGAGITNSSGTTQTFAISDGQNISFQNNATAGDQTNFTLAPSATLRGIVFYGAATAGSATYTIDGSATGGGGAELQFLGLSSGAEGIFSNLGGNGAGSEGGLITFVDSARGGNGTFTNEGGVGPGALGASMVFEDTSNAENATLIARGGVGGGGGATIKFIYSSTGGNARVELVRNGALDIHLASGPVSVGSLEGNGQVMLSSNTLSVGSNNLRTSFAGVISGNSGSLEKIGRGVLVLQGANTYGGTTTLRRGALFVNNRSGSGTGTGPVNIDGGTLAGTGNIAGDVIVGGPTGRAVLSAGRVNLGTLTIVKTLTFAASGTYEFTLDSSQVASDEVVANGVTIDSGATFNPVDTGTATLAAGTVFTVIDNTSTTPISGTFGNLADGSSVVIGANTFQANYEGGDGNDFTLTVVP